MHINLTLLFFADIKLGEEWVCLIAVKDYLWIEYRTMIKT